MFAFAANAAAPARRKLPIMFGHDRLIVITSTQLDASRLRKTHSLDAGCEGPLGRRRFGCIVACGLTANAMFEILPALTSLCDKGSTGRFLRSRFGVRAPLIGALPEPRPWGAASGGGSHT